MIKQYLQILFVFSSISFIAGCSTFREASSDVSKWINGSTQEHQTAVIRQAPQPTAKPNQTATNANTAAPATGTGTITNKTTNINSKTNIIPVISQPVDMNPAPTPKAPTVNDTQTNTEEPEVRSTPNTE